MKAICALCCAALAALLTVAAGSMPVLLATEAPSADDGNPFEIARGPGPSAPLSKWGVVRLGAGSKRVFSGVRQIAFSPDGRHVAAGDGQCARIWEIEGLKEDCSILLRQSSLTLLTFARDGQALITSGSKVGEEIRLWNTETGENLATFGPGGPFVGISSDSATLFVGGDGQIVRYSVATVKEQHRSSLQSGPLALAPDGQYIAVISSLANDRGLPRVEIRDMSGAGHSKLDGLEGLPTCALFSPDGTRFVAADRESSHVHLWVIGRPSRTPALRGHAAPVNAMAFSTDGRHLATASEDTTVVLWEVATGQPP